MPRGKLQVWQDEESGCWRARTAEGTFVLTERDGGLSINGTGPSDDRLHHFGFNVRPVSANLVVVHYESRDRRRDA